MAFYNDPDFLNAFDKHWKKFNFQEKSKTVLQMIVHGIENLELPPNTLSIKDFKIVEIVKVFDRMAAKNGTKEGDFCRSTLLHISEIARKKVAPDADKERFYLKFIDCYWDEDYLMPVPKFIDDPTE